MLWTICISDWLCHQIFSLAVQSHSSHPQKKHEALITLHHICPALASSQHCCTGGIIAVTRILPAGYCKMKKTCEIPMGQLGPEFLVPQSSEMSSVVLQKAEQKSSQELLTPARGAQGAGAVAAGWTSSHASRALSPVQSSAAGMDSIS